MSASSLKRYEDAREMNAKLAAIAEVAGARPTTEIGSPFEVFVSYVASGPRDQALLNLALAEDLEHVPELMHPMSVSTFRQMRNDAHLDALYRGTTMPILRYKWMVDANGCDPKRVQKLAGDLGLPIKGADPAPIPRYKRRFQFRNHLRDALRSLYYGHYAFEIVGEVEDPVIKNGSLSGGLWHLRKLAPRPPHTIHDLRLAPDGGLVEIIQTTTLQTAPGTPSYQLTGGIGGGIPVNRIVWYAWDQEGANWWGRSWFRSCYRNWLIKDRLVRVDAVKHERNGMGVPVGIGAQGYTDDELKALSALAQSFRAGENAGGAIPFGTDLKLLGVSGSLPDTIASIRFHNEEMSRAFLMMLVDLGSTKYGSRALGEEFATRLDLSQDGVARWFADHFTEHVIEDYWDWNYGEDEEFTPRLEFEHDDDPRVATADLALMIQNGVIEVDLELEKAVRDAMHLPMKDESTTRILPALQPKPADATTPDGQPPNVKDQPKPEAGKASAGLVARARVSSPALEPRGHRLTVHPELLEADED
jgi:hypothetical protein